MKVHQLKTWPIFFEAVLNGTKTFEIRLNDRNFQVGDKLDLMEYDPDAEGYTGRHCHRFVSYVLDANPFFDFKGHVILGLKPVEIPEISDEEIESKAESSTATVLRPTIGKHQFNGFIRGAKWYRSELKKRLK